MNPGRWWRAQDACVDHPKLIKLGDKAFRNWFNLMCVASTYGGILPDLGTVAIKLRMSESRVAAAIAELVAANLFDKREDGRFVPHDWDQWQFRTDSVDGTNAQRQRKFRESQKHQIKELRALRNGNFLALRNGVTDVTMKRPDTETDKITSTENVERGLSEGKAPKRPSAVSRAELAEIYARKGT